MPQTNALVTLNRTLTVQDAEGKLQKVSVFTGHWVRNNDRHDTVEYSIVKIHEPVTIELTRPIRLEFRPSHIASNQELRNAS
jgi:hypothetical protein